MDFEKWQKTKNGRLQSCVSDIENINSTFFRGDKERYVLYVLLNIIKILTINTNRSWIFESIEKTLSEHKEFNNYFEEIKEK